MDKEERTKDDEIAKDAGEQPAAEPSERDAGRAATEPGADAREPPVDPSTAPTTPGQDTTKIRALVSCDPLDGGIARAMKELRMSERTARNLGLIRSPLDDLSSGRNRLQGVARAVVEAMEAAGGFSALHDRMTRASAGLDARGGLEKVIGQQREMERTISGLGGIDAIFGRHSAMRNAVTALGGIELIMKQHDEMNLLASGSLAAAGYATGTSFAASQAIERAMRDIAGVSSFTGLLGNGGLDRVQFDALISGAQAWRAAAGSVSLVATLHTQLPDLVPERRRATAADFESAGLSRFGERFASESARLSVFRCFGTEWCRD